MARTHRIGVFVPTSGPAGIWGPSCRASAELACAEINAAAGDDTVFRLRFVDAGSQPADVARRAVDLIAARRIDSIVGMHTSDVRDALAAAVGRRVPYIYTPLHEGSAPNNVCCLGVTPERQLLLPALNWLSARYRLRRWYFVGNDYVWPRVSPCAGGAGDGPPGRRGGRQRPMSISTRRPPTSVGSTPSWNESKNAGPDAVLLSPDRPGFGVVQPGLPRRRSGALHPALLLRHRGEHAARHGCGGDRRRLRQRRLFRGARYAAQWRLPRNATIPCSPTGLRR